MLVSMTAKSRFCDHEFGVFKMTSLVPSCCAASGPSLTSNAGARRCPDENDKAQSLFH